MSGQIVIMTKGLPGSGKSTWARDQLAQPGNRFKCVNKDALRLMLDGGVWSKQNEKFVLRTRDWLIEQALTNGHDVIVDDTNLAPTHERRIGELAVKHGATVHIKDFTDVDVKTCIERDLKRPNSVGQKVILSMWKKFLFEAAPDPVAPAPVAKAPRAVIVDIDGTVAKMVARGPYEYAKVGTDAPRKDVIRMLGSWVDSAIGSPYKVIFCSGRPELCREETEDWLRKHVCEHIGLISSEWQLLMRPTNLESDPAKRDHRPDYLVKEEIYTRHIRGKFNVEAVYDDRDQVVSMWRSNGLLCLQVAPGDF